MIFWGLFVIQSPFFISKSHCREGMNIYEYNSSTINYYSIEDCGQFSHFMEEEDHGNLLDQVIEKQDFYTIDCSKTLIPFGIIKVKTSETKYNSQSNIFEIFVDLNTKSIILHGIIIRWIGFSVLFQLSNDLQRSVIPDISGGGKS